MTALKLHDLNYNVFAVQEGGKKPVADWIHLQVERLTRGQLQKIFAHPCNVAIICGELRETGVNVIGVDFDTEEVFQKVYPSLPESPMVVKSPRGRHVYYQLPLGVRADTRTRIGGLPIDLRGQGGYLIAPPSYTEHGKYEFLRGPVNAKDLPFFPQEFLRKETRTSVEIGGKENMILRARAYISKIESISGQGGSNACFRACCKLVDFGLSEETAWALLTEWNETNAKPPWSMKELKHKLDSAFERKGRNETDVKKNW